MSGIFGREWKVRKSGLPSLKQLMLTGLDRIEAKREYCRLHAKKSRLNGTHKADAVYWRNRRLTSRLKVLRIYGGCCVCCGETESQFLTIDHVENDGNKERGKYAWACHIYQRLADEGSVNSKYQLLCWNCNCAKGKYGCCPHKRRKAA